MHHTSQRIYIQIFKYFGYWMWFGKRAFQIENTYLLITLLEFCLDALLGTPFDNICASITSVPLAFVLIFEALKSNLNCANLK